MKVRRTVVCYGRRIGRCVSVLLFLAALGGLLFCALRDRALDHRNQAWRNRFAITADEEAGQSGGAGRNESGTAGRSSSGEMRSRTADRGSPGEMRSGTADRGSSGEMRGGRAGRAAFDRGEEQQQKQREDLSEKMSEKKEIPADPELLRRYDFAEMREVNPEIAAWIRIPETGIDYPVCRHSDDSYYLKHGPDGGFDPCGAVFLPAGTETGDAHVIFYGHNMRSGRMFGELKKYKDPDFAAGHPFLYVYTPESVFRAEIFSCHISDCAGDAYETGLRAGSETYGVWIRKLWETDTYIQGRLPGPDQRCITLSTCTGRIKSERLVVHAAVEEERLYRDFQ